LQGSRGDILSTLLYYIYFIRVLGGCRWVIQWIAIMVTVQKRLKTTVLTGDSICHTQGCHWSGLKNKDSRETQQDKKDTEIAK